MKKFFNISMVAALLAVFMAAGASDVSAQRTARKKPALKKAPARTVKRPATTALYTVPSGTRIHVRMNGTLNSKTAAVGDRFTTTVTEPVYSSNGVVVVPAGSEVIGRVDSVQRAVKGGKPGSIDVSFRQVKLPNGRVRTINGSLTDLDSKTGKSDEEGTASGDKMKHRKIIFIGGGGAGGAVLGAAIGGGKGALIGGLIGAGAGFLGERFTKGENVNVKSGTEFGVLLNQSASFPRFAETTP